MTNFIQPSYDQQNKLHKILFGKNSLHFRNKFEQIELVAEYISLFNHYAIKYNNFRFNNPSFDSYYQTNVTMLNKFNADAVQQRIDECTKIINQESANQ